MLRLLNSFKHLKPSLSGQLMGSSFHTTTKQLGGGDAEFVVGFLY